MLLTMPNKKPKIKKTTDKYEQGNISHISIRPAYKKWYGDFFCQVLCLAQITDGF